MAKPFGQILKETRESRSMSASDLARLVHVTTAAVWNWENNNTIPRRETLALLAQVLNVSTVFLVPGTPKIVPAPAKTSKASLEDRPMEDLLREIIRRGFRVSVSPEWLSGPEAVEALKKVAERR
jgi:transcriptional regulator with XRE-family HTH domain